MTDQDERENNLQGLERADWPDEAPTIEDPFRDSPAGSSDYSATPVRDSAATPDSQIQGQPSELGEVWLSGPPPDEFPFVQTAQPFNKEGQWPNETPQLFEPAFVPVVYTPETTGGTVRQTGLAWSAGIVFFGSVAFMLFLGWLADWLFGSAPWGIVAGVVLGSIIGFIQFFRISSQIHAPKNHDHRPLLTRHDDEEQPPQF